MQKLTIASHLKFFNDRFQERKADSADVIPLGMQVAINRSRLSDRLNKYSTW